MDCPACLCRVGECWDLEMWHLGLHPPPWRQRTSSNSAKCYQIQRMLVSWLFHFFLMSMDLYKKWAKSANSWNWKFNGLHAFCDIIYILWCLSFSNTQFSCLKKCGLDGGWWSTYRELVLMNYSNTYVLWSIILTGQRCVIFVYTVQYHIRLCCICLSM